MKESLQPQHQCRRAADASGNRRTAWTKWLKRALLVAALLLAAFLIYRTLSRYNFQQVAGSVTAFPLSRMGMAGLFAAASYGMLTGFDALAIRYVGKRLSYPRIALTSFVSLSIGHNIGFAGLSSGAIRYRFYSRWGLSAGEVAKVVLFSGLTVGIGLTTLGGVSILLRPALAAKLTGLSQPMLLLLAAGCLGVVALYLMMAGFFRGRIRFRGWSLRMPSLSLALGQIVIGSLNFALVAACLHQTLIAVTAVPYLTAATAFVLANAGALATHVPGGLGVIEAVVLFLLPQAELIGAVLVFRFVYFLVPLAVGGIVLALCELNWRCRQAEVEVPPSDPARVETSDPSR